MTLAVLKHTIRFVNDDHITYVKARLSQELLTRWARGTLLSARCARTQRPISTIVLL